MRNNSSSSSTWFSSWSWRMYLGSGWDSGSGRRSLPSPALWERELLVFSALSSHLCLISAGRQCVSQTQRLDTLGCLAGAGVLGRACDNPVVTGLVLVKSHHERCREGHGRVHPVRAVPGDTDLVPQRIHTPVRSAVGDPMGSQRGHEIPSRLVGP